MKTPRLLNLIPALAAVSTCIVHADLVIETETAELGVKGDSLVSAALQVERDKDGGLAYFTVNQYEYAITDRSEILIEPFFYEWNKPKNGPGYSGVGDLEISPSYMMMIDNPQSWIPAAVAAFKLKVPTATNRNIGSGEFDYQPYIIFGKNIGPWICNANFGYDFVTSTKTEKLKDQYIFDLSVQRNVTENLGLFAEVFANTSPIKGENGTFAGAVAAEYKINKYLNIYTSLGYDTGKVITLRSGFNIEW